ncbi:hypothetical protein N5079_18720 [Planotetraspora sp. A-T 1434]|nr:hypothetical protein [Planotetraspora sp. A-T 1434]MCT9932239.1 hypothetical protein [Planotetraspora sp. A-T 1434]
MIASPDTKPEASSYEMRDEFQEFVPGFAEAALGGAEPAAAFASVRGVEL